MSPPDAMPRNVKERIGNRQTYLRRCAWTSVMKRWWLLVLSAAIGAGVGMLLQSPVPVILFVAFAFVAAATTVIALDSIRRHSGDYEAQL